MTICLLELFRNAMRTQDGIKTRSVKRALGLSKSHSLRPLHLVCKKAGFRAKKRDFSKNPGFQPPTDKKPGFRWAPTVCTLKSRFFAIWFRKKTGFCAKNRDFMQKSWISEMSEIPLFCNSNRPWAPTMKSTKNDPEILFFC